jgi:methylenetetrahydrofolate reductase (NADPH)
MPVMDEPECDRLLALKNQYARDTGTEMFVMTQWSLDVATIHRWLDRIEAFNTLPIYLGIPGPTTPATLLKFAKLCGVKTSLLGLRNQSGRLGKLLTVQTPDYLVDGLSGRIDHFHLYTFGGVKRSRDWLSTRQSDIAIPA